MARRSVIDLPKIHGERAQTSEGKQYTYGAASRRFLKV